MKGGRYSVTLAKAKGEPPNAKSNEDTGERFYTWQGKTYPSVTTLRRQLGMPFRLAMWQMNQAIDAAIRNEAMIGSHLFDDGPVETAKWLRKEAMGVRDSSANRGTAIHLAAHEGRHPSQVAPEIAGPLAQFYDFIFTTHSQVVLSERQVFNLSLGYGGSLDAGMIVPSGPLTWAWDRKLVVDYKTGRDIYSDHALQLMAYSMGDFIGEDDVIDKVATEWLREADGLAILHLSDDSWELVEIDPTPYLLERFEEMCRMAHFFKDYESIERLVKRRIRKP